VTENGEVVLTPTLARFLRLSLFWVAIAFIVLMIALITVAVSNSNQAADPMSATNPAPNGAKALVEVLRHEGVRVTVRDTLAATKGSIVDPAKTTIFVYDPGFYLSAQQSQQLLGLAANIVVLDPSYDVLNEISPNLAQAGYVDGALTARCHVDAATAAEKITGTGTGFRVLADTPGVETCFGSGDDVYSLVRVEQGTTTYTLLGATDALTNGVILDNGNAALGLNLLGATGDLVWYVPSVDDLGGDIPSTAELSPPWVLPITLLFFLVAITAALWRGRRLGPLVVENLPVTVRASETMQGRARLYEKASARQHTLDSLRIGAIARLAKLNGLPVLASVDEVIAASAAVAGIDQHAVRNLLIDAHPLSDRELVRLSDELLSLEERVAFNSRPH
jgi:hypothetical protein